MIETNGGRENGPEEQPVADRSPRQSRSLRVAPHSEDHAQERRRAVWARTWRERTCQHVWRRRGSRRRKQREEEERRRKTEWERRVEASAPPRCRTGRLRRRDRPADRRAAPGAGGTGPSMRARRPARATGGWRSVIRDSQLRSWYQRVAGRLQYRGSANGVPPAKRACAICGRSDRRAVQTSPPTFRELRRPAGCRSEAIDWALNAR
jgi:hypothetical protein